MTTYTWIRTKTCAWPGCTETFTSCSGKRRYCEAHIKENEQRYRKSERYKALSRVYRRKAKAK